MDVLDKKTFNNEIKDLVTTLRFKNEPIELKGSASLLYQKYFSDYDFFTLIDTKKYNKNAILTGINKVIEKLITSSNYYLTEIKLQTLDGTKKKYNYPDIIINKKIYNEMFKDLDFIKIDIVLFTTENKFMEASVIYKLYKKSFSENDFIEPVKNEIQELMKEKMYYKVLKRNFSLYQLDDKNHIKQLKQLTEFFNSDVGFLYKIKSNIEAIELVKKFYKDNLTNNRIKENLRLLKPYKLNDYNKIMDKINTSALEFGKFNKYI